MTRTPLRRLAALAVPGLLILSGLTACQTQPGVAAFVGSKRITEARLRAVVEEGLKQKAIAQKVGTHVEGYRQMVLSRLLKHVLLASAAGELHVSVSTGEVDRRFNALLNRPNQPPVKPAALTAAFVSAVQLPPSELRPFLRDQALMEKIGRQITSGGTFSEAEIQKFYDENGGPASGQPLEQLRPQVIAALISDAAQKYVVTAAGRLRLKVNPRYGRFDRSKLFDANGAASVVPSTDDLVHVVSKPAA